jgi:hypothetical protein
VASGDCAERRGKIQESPSIKFVPGAGESLIVPAVHSFLSVDRPVAKEGAGGRRRARIRHAIRRIMVSPGVEKPGFPGTWPIMQLKNGQRVSITWWFMGTLKDGYIERNRLMVNGTPVRKLSWFLFAAILFTGFSFAQNPKWPSCTTACSCDYTGNGLSDGTFCSTSIKEPGSCSSTRCTSGAMIVSPQDITVCQNEPVPNVVVTVIGDRMEKYGDRILHQDGAFDWGDGSPDQPLQFGVSSGLNSTHSKREGYDAAADYYPSVFFYENREYNNGSSTDCRYVCRKQASTIVHVLLSTDLHCAGGKYQAPSGKAKSK